MSAGPLRYDAYDALADVYAAHWSHVLAGQIEPVLDQLVLGDLPEGSAVLDLCCGTGDLAATLCRRGLRVTGLDGSAEMLRLAAERAPGVELVLDDARTFSMPHRFQVVVSLFDSLNHLMAPSELATVFANVYEALTPGGVFVFDLNAEAAYIERWDDDFGFVEDDHAVLVRVRYDSDSRVGTFHATVFRADGEDVADEGAHRAWRRSDPQLRQRPYEVAEIVPALSQAGFTDVQALDAESELGLGGHVGRVFYVARRPVTD